MSLRENILAVGTRKEKLSISELGFDVYLRELTYAEMKSIKDGEEPAFNLLALSLVDENGAGILSVTELQSLANSVVQKMLTKALQVNKLSTASEEAKKN